MTNLVVERRLDSIVARFLSLGTGSRDNLYHHLAFTEAHYYRGLEMGKEPTLELPW
jgi:hypothetical protein